MYNVYFAQYNIYFLPSRFIKRLCNFYKPSNHLYSVIVYSEEHSRKYSSVGKLLVKYLCRAEEVCLLVYLCIVRVILYVHCICVDIRLNTQCLSLSPPPLSLLSPPPPLYFSLIQQNPTGYLYELLQDIVVELSQVTASKLTADVFSASSVAHKLARDYFLFIGTVSFYKPDLLAQCKIYAP